MIYLFLAEGFEECEALAPLDILRRKGIEIKTVGIGGKVISGAHSVKIEADLTENEILLDGNLDAVILPGGMPGTVNLEKNQIVKNTLDFMFNENRLICAICAAPKILGNMGLLKGKNATCFPGYESELLGAFPKAQAVVEDGNYITARGPGAAFKFGFAILERFTNKATAEALQEQMQCNL